MKPFILLLKSGLLKLVVVYRPPSYDVDLSLMESALDSLCLSKCSKTVISGDFSIDVSVNGTNTTAELLGLMGGFGLHQLVTQPTRVTHFCYHPGFTFQ